MSANSRELALNRRMTKWFIDRDPSTIVLSSPNKVQSGTAWRVSGKNDKDPQTVKIIWPGGDGFVLTTPDGRTRRFDFIIVGEHDADIEIDDFFEFENGNKYTIEYLFPANGYEVKGGGSSHGAKPGGTADGTN